MRPEAIFIDSIGVGAGLADRLRELDVPAVAVSVRKVSSKTRNLCGSEIAFLEKLESGLKRGS